MRLLAFDPGSNVLGWSSWEMPEGAPAQLVGAGLMRLTSKSIPERVLMVRDHVRSARATHIAIEEPGAFPFRSMAAGTKLFEMIGILRAIAAIEAVDVKLVPDPVVKAALAHDAHAPKWAVHNCLLSLGYPLPKVRAIRCGFCHEHGLDPRHSPDAADAIAVGHVACDMLRSPLVS